MRNESRALTLHERELVSWMLEHGKSGAAHYLPQIEELKVVGRCPCGCASVDFGLRGETHPPETGMEILSDYSWRSSDGYLFGIFVFARSGSLAGLEVWSIDGAANPEALPQVEDLTPLEFESGER